jgi:hypothetical protein
MRILLAVSVLSLLAAPLSAHDCNQQLGKDI